jgi:aminomethyltransferase
LHAEHRKLGARLVPFAGWEMPIQYQGISAEHQAVRERAGLFDVSHMGELEIHGERAVEAVNRLVTNDLARVADGQAMYTCCCNAEGKILDDLIVYRRSPSHVLVVCNASNRDKIAAHFGRSLEPGLDFRDVSDDTALIALQGPRALAILTAAGCGIDVRAELRSFHFKDGTLAGARCTIARTGYTGEDGVEIFSAWNDSPRIWNALLDAGKAEGPRASSPSGSARATR